MAASLRYVQKRKAAHCKEHTRQHVCDAARVGRRHGRMLVKFSRRSVESRASRVELTQASQVGPVSEFCKEYPTPIAAPRLTVASQAFEQKATSLGHGEGERGGGKGRAGPHAHTAALAHNGRPPRPYTAGERARQPTDSSLDVFLLL
ncbi:hypothetical protein RR46_13552 [Papilio xuthus]|uniref:Uncharacterized protein n=1 Tax=Papilio xuthus TaxID=66420 RepID=A0A194PG17_PAPXU|nr:hypothetical protein RR46_13552 [Papilio xuthus]